MAVVEIPLPNSNDFPLRYTTILNNTTYVFYFTWNTRSNGWYMSISTVDEVLLLSEIKLVPNLDLIAQFPDSRKPKGAIILLHNGDDVNNPPVVTFDNIATEYTLNFVN
jgi:hypothetical protein